MKSTDFRRGLYAGTHGFVSVTKALKIADKKDACNVIDRCLAADCIEGVNYLLEALKNFLEGQNNG